MGNNKDIERLFRAKKQLRKERAKLSFEEKIKILVHLQELVNSIKPSSKKIWKI